MTGWINPDVICPECSHKGKHLLVDGCLLYCGRCDQQITDDYAP